MKNSILTAFFVALSLIGFAQNAFNTKTFEAIDVQFRTNPSEWLNKYAADNLVFIMDEGAVLNKKGVLSIYQMFDETERKISDLQASQNDKTATVVGIMEHTLVGKSNKQTTSNRFRFSYTFTYQNNHWMLVSGHHSALPAPEFTQAMFNDLNARYLKNPSEFLKAEATPNFLYTGSDSRSFTLQETIKIFDVMAEVSREYSDVKILQNGQNAIISGKMKHVSMIKATNQKKNYDEVATATLVYKKGKWLLQSTNHTTIPTK